MVRRLPLVVVMLFCLGALSSVTAWAQAPAKEGKEAKETKAKLSKDDEYYELLKEFVDAMDQVERNYVDKVDRRDLMQSAIKGVLSKLDPYSNYISSDDLTKFRDNVDSKFGGIGIQITVENGQLKIISPLVGSPAYREGLESGDAIIEIEGKTTENITVEDAVSRLKGEPDTSVTIKIRRPDNGKIREVTLTREEIHIDTVLGDLRKGDDAWDLFLDHDKKIAYIRITAFSRDTTEELEKAMKGLKAENLKGLIVDLRFNPGGLLSSAIEISDMFVSSGKIVSTKGRNAEERAWEAKDEGTYTGFPMAILVNHYSASASEIVAACLQDHKRAVIIGERTWGKGSVQNVIELDGGKSPLKLTTASYWRPSGKNIHRAPGSTEWGVNPNDGMEVKVEGDELRKLVSYRRDRDILKRHAPKDSSDDKKPDEEKNPGDDKKPAASKKSDDEKKPDEKKPDAKKPGDKNSDDTETEPEDARSDKVDDKFVDRQLQCAMQYLIEELGKAS